MVSGSQDKALEKNYKRNVSLSTENHDENTGRAKAKTYAETVKGSPPNLRVNSNDPNKSLRRPTYIGTCLVQFGLIIYI